MEYLVLARKWRPQSFDDVVGQEHVVKTLRNAILQERIAHAFIFGGPRGVGKTSVARILAKALNCEKGPTPAPCQLCSNCREITAGTSMDVREIDGASNRGIDEIRELRENVKFSPASSLYRIFIIDEVHMLTREAFNALLKTLEEPPPRVIFIFATTEIHKIPPTILSRCQCHDFRMISLRLIAEKLKQITEAEGIKISGAAVAWIAAAGNGSLRDAQSIFDQVISFAGADIKDADVEELLGLTDRRYVLLLAGAVLAGDAGACLKIIEEAYYAGVDMKYFYQLLLGHFRNLLFVKVAGQEAALFDLADNDLEKLKEQAAPASRGVLQKLLDILLLEEENMRRSQHPRLHLEAAAVRMACLEELVPIDEILGRMENLEKRLKTGALPETGRVAAPSAQASPPAEKTAGAYPAPEGRGAYSVREEKNGQNQDLWEDYKAFVKKSSHPLWSKIEKGRYAGYSDRVLTIAFPRGFVFLDALKEKDVRERLAEISRNFFREDMEVKIEVDVPNGAETSEKRNGVSRNNYDIKREALNHPMVQKVYDIFEGAEVVEIIPKKNNS